MDVGCRDRAFRGSDNDLIEPPNHVAGRIEPAYRSFTMRIDLQGAVLIARRAQRARQLVLRATAKCELYDVEGTLNGFDA
jgi:hypothetical protein